MGRGKECAFRIPPKASRASYIPNELIQNDDNGGIFSVKIFTKRFPNVDGVKKKKEIKIIHNDYSSFLALENAAVSNVVQALRITKQS